MAYYILKALLVLLYKCLILTGNLYGRAFDFPEFFSSFDKIKAIKSLTCNDIAILSVLTRLHQSIAILVAGVYINH